jgi:hypothetical protein
MGDTTVTTAAATTSTAGTGAASAPPAASTETKVDAVAKAAPASMLDESKAGETKTDEKKEGAESKVETKTDDKKPAIVDDKWEAKAVDGVSRDPKVFGAARSLFSKIGLTQEQAQALVDFSDAQAVEGSKAAEAAVATRRAESWKAIESDKELGGAKLAESKKAYQDAVRAFGGKELADFLKSQGLENELPIVRALVKAGRALKEDTVNGTTTDTGKPVGDKFERHVRAQYPGMFKEK